MTLILVTFILQFTYSKFRFCLIIRLFSSSDFSPMADQFFVGLILEYLSAKDMLHLQFLMKPLVKTFCNLWTEPRNKFNHFLVPIYLYCYMSKSTLSI